MVDFRKDDDHDELEVDATVPLNEHRALERQYRLNVGRLEVLEKENARLEKEAHVQDRIITTLNLLILDIIERVQK